MAAGSNRIMSQAKFVSNNVAYGAIPRVAMKEN
jgi:hypothetical protein